LNSPDTKKTVIVENCNIHGRDDSRADDLFDIDGAPGTTFTLSNSIISSIQLGQIWDVRDNVTDSIMNVYYFDIDSVQNMTTNTWSYEAAFTETDPMFSNGPAGALYLDPASPARTASTTGGIIGDPRWADTPGVAELFSLTADAGILMPRFDPGTLDYTLEVPYGTTSVEIGATAALASATVDGAGAVDVSSGSGTATVVVTAGDATTQTYTVAITVALPSTDASLAAMAVDVGTLTPEFDPAVYDYTLLAPVGTGMVIVSATLNDETASMVVTDTVDISSGSGVATVVVTAQDGVTVLTYTITITLDNTGVELDPVKRARLYYHAASDQLMIFDAGSVERVHIYSLTGKLVTSAIARNQESLEINMGSLEHGLYVVRMQLSTSEIQTEKFVKY
jgi:hypothetical protein